MDSFVFYDSFLDTAECFEEDAGDFLYHAARCLIGREKISDQPMAYAAAITQMRASVTSAKERYEKAKEDGAKGGRPPKYIPPEDWQPYYEEHGRKATAERFGIPESTLKHWINALGKKGKNPNVNENDNVNDNANVNVSNIINNNKNTGSNGETSKVPVLPELGPGECWTSEPMKVRNTGQWAAYYKTADGEERCMVFGEPT